MRKAIIIILSSFVVIGLAIALYPTCTRLFNDNDIVAVATQTLNISQEQSEQLLKEASEYNACLKASNYSKYDNYYNVLNPNGTGVMGMLQIEKLNMALPIYHDATDENIRKGVGHLCYTPFPIGEAGVSVLTSHSGLPNATLFTDLTEMKKDDKFDVVIAGKTMEYVVDQISVVKPEQVVMETAYNGDENSYVSLVTCTPVGVNTHRLIVRGRMTSVKASNTKTINTEVKQSSQIKILNIILLIGLPLLFVAIIIISVLIIRKRRGVKG